jgi:multiple sugar transport system substrate-binding protein
MFALALSPVFAGGGSQGGSGTKQDVTIEFIQWWEEQVTPGVFRQLMDQFESENPGIKVRLNSGPYASTKEQLIAGAATKTMPDVVGLDGAWVNDFASRGVISNLTSVMKQYNYNDGELGAQIKVNNNTYMIPVVNFAYPMFINNDILGNTPMPTNRSEFLRIAKAITNPSKNTYGWALPISLETPNGIQNDVMSWLWASGKTMMKNGRPDLTNTDVKSTVQFIKDMYDAGVIAPGAFAMKEIEKIEQFRNGRIGMAIGTLAWVNMVREAAPNLKFSVIPIPPADNFTGKQGMLYASWGIGIAENSKHKEEAWKLIAFLMREDINSKLSTHSNSFPGNLKSVPDYVKTDEVFRTVFELYQKSYLVNEFTGLPVAENLMRVFDEQLQLTLEGKQSIDTMLEKVQADWDKEFK